MEFMEEKRKKGKEKKSIHSFTFCTGKGKATLVTEDRPWLELILKLTVQQKEAGSKDISHGTCVEKGDSRLRTVKSAYSPPPNPLPSPSPS